MLNQLLSSPPALLTFVGAIIVAAGVFWAALNNAASQKEILRLNRQVTEKSDQIAKLNEHLVDLVTGGDSFIYLDCIPRQNLPFLVLIHKRGEFPLYDVNVRIVDLHSKPASLGTQWVLGNYPRGTADYTFEHILLPRNGDEASFSFFFNARNVADRAGTRVGYCLGGGNRLDERFWENQVTKAQIRNRTTWERVRRLSPPAQG
jgi:hypothetical protein